MREHRGRISIIYYFTPNPINPTLQPAVSPDQLRYVLVPDRDRCTAYVTKIFS